jgi:adenosylcobinamide-phosphate synthase
MLTGHSAGTLAVLLAALLLDLAFGDPPWLWRRVPHPVVLLGRLIEMIERHLLVPGLSRARKRRRGVLLVALVLLACLAVALPLASLARLWPPLLAVEAVLMATLLAWRNLAQHVAAVARELEQSLDRGRGAVAHIVGRDPGSLDTAGVGRAAIESLAENYSDGVVAPLFWGLLFGLPGMLAYKAVNTLDSMVGHRSERYREFGWASARLDDLLNLVPARLSGVLIALGAALVRDARPVAALRTMLRDAPRHRSPNAGWPESAMAGALGLRLAGPRRYGGVQVDDAWMGDGRADVTGGDIRRGLVLARAAHCLLIGSLGVVFGAVLAYG